MSNLHQRVELLSNIGIIFVSILLGGVLVKHFLPAASPPPSPPPQAVEERIKPGTKLSLSGVDWNQGDKTLLMVLSTGCHFCTDSAPFYQRLTQQKVSRRDLRLIAVLPQSVGEAEKYLKDHGISVDEVRQAAPSAVHATATPTLIMVDRNGSVIESWIGKLPPDKEAEVLTLLLGEHSGS